MEIIETNLQFKNLEKRKLTRRTILHHAEASNCTAEDIHRWHLNRGWAGAGYHFLVRKDGKVYRLRPEDCVGAQYMVSAFGGNVIASKIREYGRANLTYINKESKLMKDVPCNSQVWMSHGDTIETMPKGYEVICSTDSVKNAGYKIDGEETYAIQFHPEVYHSTDGLTILKNFVVDICGCRQEWTEESFVETTIKDLREKLREDKVVLGLSGGVDSSVAAMLLHKAIGDRLNCIFVDNGLLRKNEFENVLESYRDMGLNVTGVDAKNIFYEALNGLTDPEKKRKAIGKTFIDVFDSEAAKLKDVKWLAQGTIYPDVIESCSVKGPSVTIKSHHNVGGLPDYMKLKLVEPLRSLFKDEVRRVGKTLGLKDELLKRHPFPGPGLAIRILGEVNAEDEGWEDLPFTEEQVEFLKNN